MSAPPPFTVEELEPTRRPTLEASMLPARAFTDEGVAAWEAERLFLGGWICMGHVERFGRHGAFVPREVAGESLLVVGDDDGVPHAFFNVCRHRAARLVTEREGEVRRLRCPYHAWSYEFDGARGSAPHTEDIEGFDRACSRLRPVRTEVLHGLVFCDTLGCAPPLAEHVGAAAEHLARYRVSDLARTRAITYDVAANWKAIAENYSECLHCPGVHPELNRLSPYTSGEEYDGPGLWCGGTMTIPDGAATMGRDGGGVVRPL